MKKSNKRVIWGNIDMDIADWEDYFVEEFDYELTEDEKYHEMQKLNDIYIEDEIDNLSMRLDGRILAIADLGLWNGRRQGYKIMGRNLNDIFCTNSELVEWFTEDGDLKSKQIHHDGTNYITYRMIKEDKNIDNLTNMIYNGEEVSNQRLSAYTKRLGDVVSKVYGW